jgi:hypothetical protein
MTDDPNDPWQSLADDLGLKPGEAQAPPPPKPNPPTSHRPATPSSPPPAAKPSADWSALAGELGLELPPEPAAPISRRDPVAELLGFPPPGARPLEPEEERRPKYRDYDFDEEDRFDDDRRSETDSAEPEDRGRYQEPPEGISDMDRGEEPTRASEERLGERPYRPSRRRRGRRGRGRGRDSQSGQRHPAERDERRDELPDDDSYSRPTHDDDASFEDSVEPRAEDVGDQPRRTPGRDEGDRPRRRRRGRRGRGSRDREPRSEESNNRSPPVAEENDTIDFGLESSEIEIAAEGELSRDVAESDSDLELESAHAESASDLHGGKASVRDIMTWKEAIGLIIEGNMQNRSHTSQAQHHPRGSRGRGRGRGHGRGGGGRH